MLIWIVTALAVIIIDESTQWLVITYLKPINSYPLWKDVLHLTYAENTGAAFGILKDSRWVFIIISSVAILGMIIFMIFQRNKNILFLISAGMIIGGGIGNMIDRILYGYVVDFIDFTLINFAIFNGADSFICIGAALLFIYIIFIESGKKEGIKINGSNEINYK